jgi:peptide/nickel transport system substrate-binding protein
MVLVKFEGYWRGWKANQIDKVVVKIIKEHATIKLALQSKEIDMTDAFMTNDEINDLIKTSGIIGETGPGLEMTALYFHNQRAPLNNTHVRRAISYAINYSAIQLLFPTDTMRASSCVPRTAAGHIDAMTYVYSPEMAQQELALSGYSVQDIRPLTLEVSSGDPRWISMSQLIKQNLADIGITVNIEQVTVPTMYAQAYNMTDTPDMLGFYFTETWPDAWAYLRHYRSDAARTLRTMMWVDDTWIDSKLDEASTQTNNARRLDIMGEIQVYIMENAINLFINDYPNQLAHWNYVKGFQWGGHQRNFWFYALTIEK